MARMRSRRSAQDDQIRAALTAFLRGGGDFGRGGGAGCQASHGDDAFAGEVRRLRAEIGSPGVESPRVGCDRHPGPMDVARRPELVGIGAGGGLSVVTVYQRQVNLVERIAAIERRVEEVSLGGGGPAMRSLERRLEDLGRQIPGRILSKWLPYQSRTKVAPLERRW